MKSIAVKRKHKYGNKPFYDDDGNYWHAQGEYKRWCDLKLLEKAGEISALSRQIKFELSVNNLHICSYIPDFSYFAKDKSIMIHEDFKGLETREFKIKKRLMKAIYNIDIKITTRIKV